MGSLLCGATSRCIELEPESLIGRSPQCSVRLTSTLSSSVHAVIRWTSVGWALKDLSSTNGTFVNRRRLEPSRLHPVTKGDVLAFGSVDEGWVLQDVSPPLPTATSDAGERSTGADLIALPSGDQPTVTVFRGAEGAWFAEGLDDVAAPVTDGGVIEVAGRVWRLSLPAPIAQTEVSHSHAVEEVDLVFKVSRDEEYVELTARVAETTIDLGARANNYLLLILARRREEDLRAGVDAANQGWMHQDDVARALRTDPESINVDVFRIRKRFGQHLRNAAAVIERRARTRQLRLGIASFEIQAL